MHMMENVEIVEMREDRNMGEKKRYLVALVMLLVMLCCTAVAADSETVLFAGEKSGKFVNYTSWKDVVSVNLSNKGIDRSIFETPFDVLVDYESEAAPTLFFMSWTGGTSKAQIEAAETDGSQARYCYQDILRAYGDLFSKVGSVTVRANGADVTVRRIAVVPAETAGEEEHVDSPVNGKTWQDYDPLYAAAVDNGFKVGTCYSYNQMQDKEYLAFVKQHFNSITPTNELKAYSLLNAWSTRSRTDGMPGLDWNQADAMLRWAQENGVQVRGHVLVWDAYMTDWFFREDYDSKKPYADQETVRARMAWHINEVITHCETTFPGVVYCWDVVNEAVGDNASEYVAGDARHLRTVRSGNSNLFRDLAGEDYVEFAFMCARNTVEALGADIKLFYNDYNAFQTEKSKAIAALVNSVNTYVPTEDGTFRTLCDGVGMQGYIGGYGTQDGCMNSADVQAIETAIRMYGSLGLEVQITEMSIRNYSET